MTPSRRTFIGHAATAAAAWSLLPSLRAATGGLVAAVHPRLYIAAPNSAGLQSVDDFRHAVKQGGFLGRAWRDLLGQAHAESKLPPWQTDSPVPGRPAGMIRDRNLDYFLCHHTGARMTRLALVHLITGDETCRDAALAQIRAVLDPAQWPDWIDQAHVHFGHPADLRTGMLSQDVGLAYDWLHPSLTKSERAEIRQGVDRRGIQPFLTSVEQKAWWTTDLNNWVTVIAGGVAVAAMAMREDHPRADFIIDYATRKFDDYLQTYGPAGEFNESVSYAAANRLPVGFFAARRFATGGAVNRLGAWPFPEMCRWVMHGTLDRGRPVPFGDSWPERPVMTGYVAAVAAANQDPVLQDYFLRNRAEEDVHPVNLLHYDDRLKPLSPAGREPLAIAYPAHGGMIISRTSWNQEPTECIVFTKFGREENHEHNDLGQLGFDALGERLIIDIGSPSSYPADFFESHTRWRYYNASLRGHNALMFGNREQRYPVRQRGEPIEIDHLSGQLTHWWHEAGQGTAWRMDLTPAYDGVKRVTRTGLHLWPGYLLVLDEAELDQKEPISLRWHTIDRAAPQSEGGFVVRQGVAAATGRILNLGDGNLEINRREHAYTAPFDRERNGDPLEARHESYLDATLTGDRCRLLTLFATGAAVDFGGDHRWHTIPEGWAFDGPHGRVTAAATPSQVALHTPDLNRHVSLTLT